MMFEKLYAKLAKSARETFYEPIAEEIVRKIEAEKIHSILDVGAGSGDLIFEIIKREPGLTIFGIDISPKIIEIARERIKNEDLSHKNIFFEVRDACNLSGYPDNVFDFVVSSGVLHSLKYPAEAVKEWLRVLKPGRCLWIYDPTPLISAEEISNKALLKKRLPSAKDRLLLSLARKFCRDIPPRIMSVEQITKILKAADIDHLTWSVIIDHKKGRGYVKIEIEKK